MYLLNQTTERVNNMQYDTENITLNDIILLLDKGEILEYDYGVDYD